MNMHQSTPGIMLIQNMRHMCGETISEPSLSVTNKQTDKQTLNFIYQYRR